MPKKTTEEHIVLLRDALWGADGKDRDPVTTQFAAFTKYDRNGLDVVCAHQPL